MIWKEPIYRKRKASVWMAPETGFPPGIVSLVEQTEAGSLKTPMLSGLLIRITGNLKSEEDAVVKILANLKHHADQVMYLRASQALTLQREREEHPATGLLIGGTIEEVDILVISGLQALTEGQKPMFDGLLSARGNPAPPRVTILLEPNPGFFSSITLPATMEEYGDRIIGG